MAWVALKASYIPQPRTIASDVMRTTRDISLRRTRNRRATNRSRDCREITAVMGRADYRNGMERLLPIHGEVPSAARRRGPGGASPSPTSGLLDLLYPLQGGDPLLDRRMRIPEVVEPMVVVLERVVDVHGRGGVVVLLQRLVAGRQLAQRREQAGRVAGQLHTRRVGQRLPLPRQRQLHERPDQPRDQREDHPQRERDQGHLGRVSPAHGEGAAER